MRTRRIRFVKSCMRRLVALTVVLSAAPVLAAEAGERPSLFTGDIGNIIWSLVTFVAVILLLGRFAWAPLLQALQRREDFIRESLAAAKKEREQAEARLKEYNERLLAAREEASAIVEEGRRDAELVKQKIEETTRAEAAAMLERAKREINIAAESAVKELYTLSATLATGLASRIIRKELDANEHQRLLAESVEELRAAIPTRKAGARGGNGRGLA